MNKNNKNEVMRCIYYIIDRVSLDYIGSKYTPGVYIDFAYANNGTKIYQINLECKFHPDIINIAFQYLMKRYNIYILDPVE